MAPSWDPSVFPNLLVPGSFIETSPEDTLYNCIAFAAHDTQRWWWPSGQIDDYWPPSAPLEETIEAFVAAYGTAGFSRCGNGKLERAYEKVAIYAVTVGGVLRPKHAARQLSDGRWTSKCGECEDIIHPELSAVELPGYGSPVTYLKRLRPDVVPGWLIWLTAAVRRLHESLGHHSRAATEGEYISAPERGRRSKHAPWVGTDREGVALTGYCRARPPPGLAQPAVSERCASPFQGEESRRNPAESGAG